MRIAIDLRSLHTNVISGVENYVGNLTEQIVVQDRQNHYTLFHNSFRPITTGDYHFVNSQVVATRYPNRLLNASFRILHRPSLESIIGDFDCLFLPNFNPFAILPKTKLVVTVHDLSLVVLPEFYDLKTKAWKNFLNIKGTLKRADKILAVSDYTKMEIERLYHIPEDKIQVIYPGLSESVRPAQLAAASLRAVRNKHALPGDFFLFLSTVEPRKNLLGLLKAFEYLPGDVGLVIAGKKGWKYQKIFRALKRSKKAHLIKYLGYVEESEKPSLIKMAKAVIYPSFYEGFGFVPLEAMQLGTPALLSSVTSLPEVAANGGLFFNPYNHLEMARTMSQILVDENLKNQLVQKGLLTAQRYSWQKSAAEVVKVFNAL